MVLGKLSYSKKVQIVRKKLPTKGVPKGVKYDSNLKDAKLNYIKDGVVKTVKKKI